MKAKNDGRGLVATVYYLFFNNGMAAILIGSLLPYIRAEFTLSYVQSGLLLSANQLGNLCALFIMGVLPFALGQKRSVLLLGGGAVVGYVCLTLGGFFPLLLFSGVCIGIFRGTVGTVGNATVAAARPGSASALNLLHSFFAVGALVSPVLIALCYRLGWGWRGVALSAAALALLGLGLVAVSAMPAQPRAKGVEAEKAFLQSPAFWVNTGILFFYLCAETSIIGWFVSYFTETGRLPETLASFTPTLTWVMVLLGRLACVPLSRWFDKNRLSLVLGALFTAFFVALLLTNGAASCILLLLGIGGSMAGIYPTTLAAVRGTGSTMVTGTMISLATVGAIVMPSLVGAIAETSGLAGGILAVVAALGCMLALMVAKLLPWYAKCAG